MTLTENLIMIKLLTTLALLAPLSSVQAEVAGSRPNIVFMLSDDMGWNEPGFNGGDAFHTPHIDKLRKEGTSYTRFYVHAVCAPTRAAFLTGRYAFRTWSDWRSEDFGKPSYLAMLDMELAKNEAGEETRRIHAVPTEERTVSEALKETGYTTALIGKWHCGEWLPEHLPMGQGFDHQYGHYAWGIDYNNYTIPHNAPARYAVYDWHRDQKPVYEQGYTTDLIANETVRLIGEQSKDQPFFFYVPFNAVHGPLEEIPRYTDKLDKRYAALKCLDDAVGRIVGAVDQAGFGDNTLVIFANDNGGLREEMNAPYRGTKNTNYEGGVRVPCVMRWPDKLPAGGESEALFHIVDLYNTFVTLGGGSLKQERPLDGMNMVPTLFDKAESPREEIIFEVSGSVRFPAMLRGKYKLIGEELYDLEADPSEKTDIAAQHPEIVKELKARLESAGEERPPLEGMDRLMSPALPWVYGQEENANAPQWVKDHVQKVRDTQPKEWAPGTTPWPQAPKDGKIIYTGDGR
ncbi:N-acetylgalactosamine-6-sulfatase [Roseibacillus persicicus]|uniref:N-acetylgalactosamine-6-sulfatase n=2 Tax=Roseibacillus persicicus TaxID=454148 RepID=A0A918WIL1_9BACT|nr:N-acetylgalactosamine-6-sulfatase [Roseibacillus persicicus]